MLEKSAREKFQVELGTYLREKRIEADLTQSQIAETLGLESPQFISNIERGKCAIPMHVMRQLIKEYKLDRSQFFEFISEVHMNYFKRSLGATKKASKMSRASS